MKQKKCYAKQIVRKARERESKKRFVFSFDRCFANSAA